jgi:hypothetical protein
MDLDALNPGGQLNVRANLYAFMSPEIVELEQGESWSDGMPDFQTAKELQLDGKDGLDRIRRGDWWALEKGISYGIHRTDKRLAKGRRKGTSKDFFRAAAMDTLQRFWSRLRACPRCKAIFLKTGKRKYCSPSCASRAHWEAFKERRAGRDHHREYTDRIRKRLGNLKVTPKRRKAHE